MSSVSLLTSRSLTFLSIATIMVTLFLIACNDFVELILNTDKFHKEIYQELY